MRQQLSALPTSRDYFSLLAGSPAVQMARIDVGGSTNGTQQGFVVYGTTGQVRVIFEGLNATEATGAFGNYPDIGGMEEVQINTAAHSAEASTPGVQSQFISKSGGNQFRGTFFGGYSPESWQAFNIDDDQIARGLTGGGGLDPEDVNRLNSYQDMNVGLGGYVIKDRLWWYGSYRHQDIQASYVNFPVKPQTTILNNYSAKVTYNLSTNNKLIGYTQPSQKKQPQRFDSWLLGVDTGINSTESTTWNQNFWAWVHKGEWNGVISDNSFAEIRGGQYGYDWTNGVNGTGPRYEDIGNNIINGRNRNWARERRRNQVLGTLSYFWNKAGDHNFKIGGELFDETVKDIFIDGFEDDVLHVMQNNAKLDVILFQPGESIGGLRTYGAFIHDTWRASNRLTFNLGVRFDRYRAYSPEQGHPTSRFNPTAQTFAAVDNYISWNLPAPRLGMTYDVSGNGKTVSEGQLRIVLVEPRRRLRVQHQPECIGVVAALSLDRHQQRQSLAAGRRRRADRRARRLGHRVARSEPREQLHQGVRDLRRARADAKLRRARRLRVARTAQPVRPLQHQPAVLRVHRAGLGSRSGPERHASETPTTARRLQAFDLAPEYRGLPVVNRQINVDDSDADYHTFEITGTKRMSNRWSLLASYGWTKSFDQAATIQGNAIRANALPATPNDMINTDDGRPGLHALERQVERHLELAVVGHHVLADDALPAGRAVRPHLLVVGAQLSAACASSPSRWTRGGRTRS